MHPMAAYCVLKGLVAVEPVFATETPAYRIRPSGVGVYQQLLYGTPSRVWHLFTGKTYSKIYREVGFDTVPDAVMDKLTVDLVDKLAEAA